MQQISKEKFQIVGPKTSDAEKSQNLVFLSGKTCLSVLEKTNLPCLVLYF